MADITPTQDPSVQTAISDVAKDAEKIAQDIKTKNDRDILSTVSTGYSQISPILPQVVSEIKAGYKTTEFWLVIAYEALTQTGAINLGGHWETLAAGASAVIAYVLSRGIAKAKR